MQEEPDLDDIAKRMDGAVEILRTEFAGLRTGRASPSLLDPVTADAYGTSMPINQLANVTVPEPRLLVVTVWDKASVKAVDKAIRNAGLGLNPQTEGSTIRVPIPELNEERRRELGRVAGKYAEQARIAVRNVRRDGIDHLRRAEKDGDMTKDDLKLYSDEIQSLTDQRIARIDEALASKEKDIMQV